MLADDFNVGEAFMRNGYNYIVLDKGIINSHIAIYCIRNKKRFDDSAKDKFTWLWATDIVQAITEQEFIESEE